MYVHFVNVLLMFLQSTKHTHVLYWCGIVILVCSYPPAKYSPVGGDHSKLLKLLKDPNVLYHQGEGGRTPLNEEQITALVFSLMNKFQLIQGPPGEVCCASHCLVPDMQLPRALPSSIRIHAQALGRALPEPT